MILYSKRLAKYKKWTDTSIRTLETKRFIENINDDKNGMENQLILWD